MVIFPMVSAMVEQPFAETEDGHSEPPGSDGWAVHGLVEVHGGTAAAACAGKFEERKSAIIELIIKQWRKSTIKDYTVI